MDPEAQAIDEAWQAISRLPADGQVRVIRYLAGRAAKGAAGAVFAGDATAKAELLPAERSASPVAYRGSSGADLSDRLRAIFEDREVDTTAGKILIAAALLQEENRGRPSSAREIHEPLKKAGVEISNISAQLNAISERSGRKRITRIAEKNRHHRYQVTATGMRAASEVLGQSLPSP